MIIFSVFIYALTVFLTISAILRRDGFDIFNPLVAFILYLFVQVGLSELISVLFGFKSEISLPLPEYEPRYVEAIFLGTVTTFLVYAGSVAVGGRYLALGYTTRPLSAYKSYIAVMLLLPLGYFSFWLLLEKNGGLEEFLLHRESWRSIGIKGQGIYSYPATILLNIVALINFGRAFSQRESAFQKGLACAIVLLSIVPSMFLGFRSLILFPIVQSFLIFQYCSQRISTAAAISTGAVIGILFTCYGLYREAAAISGPRSEFGLEETLQLAGNKPELALNLVLRSRGADIVATVIDREAKSGEFDSGPESLFEFLTIWVPNSLWEEKSIPSHVRFTTYFFGDTLAKARNSSQSQFGGYSPTFIGEGYWHLGVIGVVCLALIWGAIGRIAINTLRTARHHPLSLVIYSYFFIFILFSAEYIQGAAQSLAMAGVVLAVLGLALSTPDQGENPQSPGLPVK